MIRETLYIITLLLTLHIAAVCSGKLYSINNSDDLKALKLKPGDTVVIRSGVLKDQAFHLKGAGTKEAPIVLMAEKAGMVKLTGRSALKIDGQWLIVDGLFFTDGYSLKEDVVAFSKKSAYCRLTNTAIKNYNPPSDETEYKWVSLYGTNNRLDHCNITGKNHQGATVVVWLSETPNYHSIDHNYFGGRPPLGRNGGETIRIGTSDWSFHPSYTLVEDNIFDQCDGEIEIISVKSLYNTIRRNLFYESDGMLTLRHGNYNTVRDNFFIGNGKKNTGGVRIIGEHHIVSNNYMQGLRGTGIMSAISIMNTVENPKLNEYWRVKNAVIDSNIIIDCSEAFVIGSGKDAVRKVPPDSVFISYNYIQNAGSTVIENEKIKTLFAGHNRVWRSAAPAGFTKSARQLLQKDSNGIWQLPGDNLQPFWLSEAIGPGWDSDIKKAIGKIRIK
ncbi:MAG: polysaccharide lyase 6 family protein [Niabella sp.]